jgi:hypothetical protein
MVHNVYKKDKLEPSYIGPYTIDRRSRNGTYVLRDALGDVLDRRVPADQIKLIERVPTPPEEEAPIYDVERIVDHRGVPGNLEYFVAWKGYSQDDWTWEPERHILHPRPVREYWNRIHSSAAGQEAQPQRANRRQRRRAQAHGEHDE